MSNPFHENTVHGTPVFPLQVYSQHDNEGFYFVPQHWHEEFEWVYVEHGSVNITVHGKQYSLGENKICFINSGELHEIKSTGSSLHHAIVFQPKILDFEFYDLCQHSIIQPVTGNKMLFPTVFSDAQSGLQREILPYLKETVKIYHSNPSGGALSLKLQLLHVIDILSRNKCFSQNISTSTQEDSISKLKKVIGYIKENYENKITLEELAKICYMSPNYFCNYFHKETGKTPIVFINEYRIQKASKLLSQSDISISEAAVKVGFDNFSYFIRKFKEYKGVTPKQYKELVKAIKK